MLVNTSFLPFYKKSPQIYENRFVIKEHHFLYNFTLKFQKINTDNRNQLVISSFRLIYFLLLYPIYLPSYVDSPIVRCMMSRHIEVPGYSSKATGSTLVIAKNIWLSAIPGWINPAAICTDSPSRANLPLPSSCPHKFGDSLPRSLVTVITVHVVKVRNTHHLWQT